MPRPVPEFADGVIRGVANILGHTDDGLTNPKIDETLRAAGIEDPNPRDVGPGMYVRISKKDRIYEALRAAQQRTGAGNLVVRFIRKAMEPARYVSTPDVFDDRRHQLNEVLSFSGLYVSQGGEMVRGTPATTLPEAKLRARRLRGILRQREAHARVLAACVDEINDDNYFHAVLEAAKSLAEEIRRRTGCHADGWDLVTDTLQITRSHPVPLLALNALTTDTERSRQRGLEHGVRAIFSAARNPAAHEPKILSSLTERDAIDILTQVSYLHRQLDACADTGHLR